MSFYASIRQVHHDQKVVLPAMACSAALIFTTVVYYYSTTSVPLESVAHRAYPSWIYDMHRWSGLQGKYSQGAQDRYLARIFSVLGETNRYFVEFGFNEVSYESGGSGANTRNLYRKGWRGLLLDADFENPSINLKKHFLYATNIAQIFVDNAVPMELDYLSCDMDSHDLWVFRAILQAGYRPRVISTEYNFNYPLTDGITLIDPSLITKTSTLTGNGTFEFAGCAWGASAKALWLVASQYGYVLAGRVSTLDLLWIRGDLIADWMRVPKFEWFFRDIRLGKQLFSAPVSPNAVDRVVDYETFARTGDFAAGNKAAREILRERDLDCFHAVYDKL